MSVKFIPKRKLKLTIRSKREGSGTLPSRVIYRPRYVCCIYWVDVYIWVFSRFVLIIGITKECGEKSLSWWKTRFSASLPPPENVCEKSARRYVKLNLSVRIIDWELFSICIPLRFVFVHWFLFVESYNICITANSNWIYIFYYYWTSTNLFSVLQHARTNPCFNYTCKTLKYKIFQQPHSQKTTISMHATTLKSKARFWVGRQIAIRNVLILPVLQF